MCGILVSTGSDRPFTHLSLQSLRRRGPDQMGFWTDGRVQMGHTRLSIIGLDDRGIEPLENGRHVLVFNGELYNFNDIRRELEAEGTPLQGANDAEVLLHAWSRWGEAVLPRLTGFWSFVIYDKERRTLTLVRDQFGIKPLYYLHSGGRVLAASLLRTVREVHGPGLALDEEALSEYVRYQFTFGDKTFFRDVKKVIPGHLVEIDLDAGTQTLRCWEDILSPASEAIREVTSAWIDETRELLQRCVLESTISDTPFTTFCSGGIDSSLITRIAQPETAYHCNFSDPDCNETFFAQQAITRSAVRLFTVNAQEEFDLVGRCASLVEDFDELTIGSVILPLDDLLAQVKRRYKVILTGTGGDELFAGYVRYQLTLGHCFQDSYRALFAKMQDTADPAARFELTHTKGDPTLYRFFRPTVAETFRSAFDDCRNGGNVLEAMLRFDRRYFLAGLLNIDDKMCGRHSLESRPSFLHQRLVRHLLQVNPNNFLRGGDLKPVLRDIATGILPAPVLNRTDKMGFTTPIGTFVNKSAGLIREQVTTSRFRELYDLRRLNFTAETKYSREVFGLLMLDLWLNRYA